MGPGDIASEWRHGDRKKALDAIRACGPMTAAWTAIEVFDELGGPPRQAAVEWREALAEQSTVEPKRKRGTR